MVIRDRCSTPCRIKQRSQLLKNLRLKAEKLNTKDPLVTVMMEGVNLFLRGEEYLDPVIVPPQYRELVRQQNRIGWLNFLRGRWSLEWSRLQTASQHPDSISSQWASQLIRTLWESIYEIWDQRNKDLHGVDAVARNAAERLVLCREIQHVYTAKHSYPQKVWHVFVTPLLTLLQKKNYQLRNWLALWLPVLDVDQESFEEPPLEDSTV